MNSTFIIAEAGANHNRDFDLALKLIDAAVTAGSDAVKFQTYSSETLYSKNTPDFSFHANIPELIKGIELPREWQSKLKKHCDDKNIEFMSTPFDERAIEELYNLGVKRYKIAGFEATDPRFVKLVAQTGLPIILTAGIGTNIGMIGLIKKWIHEENPTCDLTILHGNNAYPTPFHDINLGQIRLIKENYPNLKVGLSDHTEGVLVPPIAVALGAVVIEKHFTLNRALKGPDHHFAIEPEQLKLMVSNIRIVEKCLGTKAFITESEKREMKAMRSVVVKEAMKKSGVFGIDKITTKRPRLENSIPAIDFYKILGKKATRDLHADDILMMNDVEGF